MPSTLLRPALKAVSLPGTSGNYISTPDSVLNSVTGDIDIRVKLKMADWSPAAIQVFAAKYGVNNTFTFGSTGAAGLLRWVWSNAESVIVNKDSTAAVPFANGIAGWVRITHDVDNGAGQNVVTFYTSVDGITWTILGAAVTTAGVTTIRDTADILELGSWGIGSQSPLNGTIYYAEVRRGIEGPIVAKYDPTGLNITGAQFPTTIPGWTVNGSAVQKYEDYVRLPGTAGNYLSWPDSAANSVTGDIDVRCKLSADIWASTQSFVSKWGAAGQLSYRFLLTSLGRPQAAIASTGADATYVDSGVTVPFADGIVGWCRFTWRQSDGRVQFFTSSDGVAWTQLGTDKSIVKTAIFDSSAAIELGSTQSVELFKGNVYYAEVRSGINGTVVAQFDARDIETPWTINGSAWNWESASPLTLAEMALSLPGTAGNYASTPDSAANSVVGDLDVRCKVSLDDWTPATDQELVAKHTGSNNTFQVLISVTTGNIRFTASSNGTSSVIDTSKANSGVADGMSKWVRVTLDADNGAGGCVTTFYNSDDGVTWTSLGSTTGGAPVTLFDGTAPIELGSRIGGTQNPLLGKVHYAEVRNGIDGPIVARFDASAVARTAVRVPTTLTQPGGSPNLLSPNTASVETDATGWQSNANCTKARSTAQFLDGAASLEMTSVAAGDMSAINLPGGASNPPVVPGKAYTVNARFRAATVARNVSVMINWFNVAGTYLFTVAGTATANSTSAWTAAPSFTSVAPATAAYGGVVVQVAATGAAAEVHYVDRISLVETPTVWTINGSAWDWVQIPQPATRGRVLVSV